MLFRSQTDHAGNPPFAGFARAKCGVRGAHMSKVERFEDLQVWQMAHELSITVYGLAKAGEFSRDWGLRNQGINSIS